MSRVGSLGRAGPLTNYGRRAMPLNRLNRKVAASRSLMPRDGSATLGELRLAMRGGENVEHMTQTGADSLLALGRVSPTHGHSGGGVDGGAADGKAGTEHGTGQEGGAGGVTEDAEDSSSASDHSFV